MLPKLHGPVTVFDLRQEDHAFVNGEPISWFATNNWANVGKTHAEIVAEEEARVRALVAGTKLSLSDDKAKKGETGRHGAGGGHGRRLLDRGRLRDRGGGRLRAAHGQRPFAAER